MDLWCRKQPLYQLSHNHCPRVCYQQGANSYQCSTVERDGQPGQLFKKYASFDDFKIWPRIENVEFVADLAGKEPFAAFNVVHLPSVLNDPAIDVLNEAV